MDVKLMMMMMMILDGLHSGDVIPISSAKLIEFWQSYQAITHRYRLILE